MDEQALFDYLSRNLRLDTCLLGEFGSRTAICLKLHRPDVDPDDFSDRAYADLGFVELEI